MRVHGGTDLVVSEAFRQQCVGKQLGIKVGVTAVEASTVLVGQCHQEVVGRAVGQRTDTGHR